MKAIIHGLVLAVYPHRQGLGWVLFEGPLIPADWGIVRPNKDHNVRCIAKVEQLVTRYNPVAVVLEQFDRGRTRRVPRIRELCNAILKLAARRKINAPIYNRATIHACFTGFGALTRYAIAKTIAAHIVGLRHRLPPSRKRWQAEDSRQSLFNAAALAITHFAVTVGASPWS